MAFIHGKITRKISKQNNEYFVGRIGNLPVRGAWSKTTRNDLYIFLDKEKIDFLSERNKTSTQVADQETDKQQ